MPYKDLILRASLKYIMSIDKPQPKPEPKPSQAMPSQAKAWAEVFYIITMCPVPSRPVPCRRKFNISASTEQNQTKLSGYSRTNPRSKLVTKNFTPPPKPKPDFLAKRGGCKPPPKLAKN